MSASKKIIQAASGAGGDVTYKWVTYDFGDSDGGSIGSYLIDVDWDASGNMYGVGGWGKPTTSLYSKTSLETKMFIVKFNSSFNIVWEKELTDSGGGQLDFPTGIAVNDNGDVVVTRYESNQTDTCIMSIDGSDGSVIDDESVVTSNNKTFKMNGIATDGTDFCVCGWVENPSVNGDQCFTTAKVSVNGSGNLSVSTLRLATTSSEDVRAREIIWDGSNYWAVGGGNTTPVFLNIAKINSGGTMNPDKYVNITSSTSYGVSIASDGTDIYVGTRNTGSAHGIMKINSALTSCSWSLDLNDYSFSILSMCIGNDGYLYALSNRSSILQIDTSDGSIQNTMMITDPNSQTENSAYQNSSNNVDNKGDENNGPLWIKSKDDALYIGTSSRTASANSTMNIIVIPEADFTTEVLHNPFTGVISPISGYPNVTATSSPSGFTFSNHSTINATPTNSSKGPLSATIRDSVVGETTELSEYTGNIRVFTVDYRGANGSSGSEYFTYYGLGATYNAFDVQENDIIIGVSVRASEGTGSLDSAVRAKDGLGSNFSDAITKEQSGSGTNVSCDVSFLRATTNSTQMSQIEFTKSGDANDSTVFAAFVVRGLSTGTFIDTSATNGTTSSPEITPPNVTTAGEALVFNVAAMANDSNYGNRGWRAHDKPNFTIFQNGSDVEDSSIICGFQYTSGAATVSCSDPYVNQSDTTGAAVGVSVALIPA